MLTRNSDCCSKVIYIIYIRYCFHVFSRFIETQSRIRGDSNHNKNHHIFIRSAERRTQNNFTFSPPYKLSQNYVDIVQFFNDGGSIAVSYGECLVYDIEFKGNDLPLFSAAFKKMLRELYHASDKDRETQRKTFERFRSRFGDYYFVHVQVGMHFSSSKIIPPPSIKLKRYFTPSFYCILRRRLDVKNIDVETTLCTFIIIVKQTLL